eukprot:TRINITY_DN23911_c0_g1_i2.p1 TRINITY_DN23911_c0_g1~~TRINITY_DN23911_c0_g1_i2.p1  ORF type:complete len:369 (-),score=36.15 TRINITY_DN23911_c0_g1_i2:1450-2556(-)
MSVVAALVVMLKLFQDVAAQEVSSIRSSAVAIASSGVNDYQLSNFDFSQLGLSNMPLPLASFESASNSDLLKTVSDQDSEKSTQILESQFSTLLNSATNGSGKAISQIVDILVQSGDVGVDAFITAFQSTGNSSSSIIADVFTILNNREELESAVQMLIQLADQQLIDIIVKAVSSASQNGYEKSTSEILAEALQQGDVIALVDASIQVIAEGQAGTIIKAIIETIDQEQIDIASFAIAQIISQMFDNVDFVNQFIKIVLEDADCEDVAEVIAEAQKFSIDGAQLVSAFISSPNYDDCLLQPRKLEECPQAKCLTLSNCCQSTNTQFKMKDICSSDEGIKLYTYAGECLLEGESKSVFDPEFGFSCYC